MQSLTITMPNGPTITWSSDDHSEAVVPNIPLITPTEPIAVPTTPKVTNAIEARSTAKPTGRTTNKPPKAKAAKAKAAPKESDSKQLLQAIRAHIRKGEFSEAVAICPASWKQVMQEIARAAERGGTTTLVPSTVLPKAAAKKVTVAPKVKKQKRTVTEQGSATVASVEVPGKCITPDVAPDRTQSNSVADTATDLGINPHLTDILRKTSATKYAAELRKLMSSDKRSLDLVYSEIELMLASCEEAARVAASANDRLLTAELDVWIGTLEALQMRCLEAASA